MTEQGEQRRLITLGRIVGAYGIAGWVKVVSNTSPMDNIIDFPNWLIGQEGRRVRYKVLSGRRQGKGIVAKLEGILDRDQAQGLKGADISIFRDQLPQPAEGEYYWVDLEGLEVRTTEGVSLGRVDYLFDTGANAVVVVKGDRERMIPYVSGQVIKRVDVQQGWMVVDWDPDF